MDMVQVNGKYVLILDDLQSTMRTTVGLPTSTSSLVVDGGTITVASFDTTK